MTDKELKKLSRLELLELLLIESHENQKLRDKLAKIEQENEVGKSVEQLNETNQQLQLALQQVRDITNALENPVVITDGPLHKTTEPSCIVTETKSNAEENEDAIIYQQLMAFFADHPHAMFIFPDDLRDRLTDRLKDVLHARIAQHRAELTGGSL